MQLDELLDEMQDRVEAIRKARDSVHALFDAVVSIGRDLDLDAVLQRIVEAAVKLVDCRYGALGVISEDGRLETFVPVGLSEDEIAAIAEWPHGRGLLGLLIKEPQTLRLPEIGEHPESFGFPAGHPPMRTFLGVQITARDTVFGNLYLTEKSDGRLFDEQDEVVITALATAAGIAVDNARMYEETRRRETWLDASADLTRALLSGVDLAEALVLVARRARTMSGADAAAVAIPTDDNGHMRIVAADGERAEEMLGSEAELAGSLAEAVYASGDPVTTSSYADVRTATAPGRYLPDGPALLLPLGARDRVRGVLALGRNEGSAPFPASATRMLTAFADQAAVALELGDARREAERHGLLDDRERIARDLHDQVIQRLFACAMTLTGAARLAKQPEVAQRVEGTIDDLDTTIRQIRSTIFALQSSGLDPEHHGVRSRLTRVVEAATAHLAFAPGVRLEGLLDNDVADDVAEHMLAVVQEALSNVVRHAHATRVDVLARVGDGTLQVEVADDGVGITDDGRRSGLANIAARAERLGGTLDIRPNGERGTVIDWRVPAHPGT